MLRNETAERMRGFRGASGGGTANGAGDALARSFGGQLRKLLQNDPDSDLPTETPRRLTAFAPFDLWVTESHRRDQIVRGQFDSAALSTRNIHSSFKSLMEDFACMIVENPLLAIHDSD